MGTDGLKQTIARFKKARSGPVKAGVNLNPDSAFEAMLDIRLQELRRQVGEVRSRVNGLFFFVLGAAIVQVALGFFA